MTSCRLVLLPFGSFVLHPFANFIKFVKSELFSCLTQPELCFSTQAEVE
jgi:hypothetical protein